MNETERLEQRIRMLMRKYVCFNHKAGCTAKMKCIYIENGDEHLCELSGYEKELKEKRWTLREH